MSDFNYWDRYGECPEPRCAAEQGEPCVDLRRWALHSEDRWWRHPIAHAHLSRPLPEIEGGPETDRSES